MKHMPINPIFQVGDVAVMSSKLRYGEMYGEVICTTSLFTRFAGREIRIKEVRKGMFDEFVYYVAKLPPAAVGDVVREALIAESMLLGTRKKVFQNRIEPDFVIKCYEQLGLYSVCSGQFFSSAGAADPLGAIYLAFGGEDRNAESVKSTLVKLYDKDYLRGFTVGFDRRGSNYAPTGYYWDGHSDGSAVRYAIESWAARRAPRPRVLGQGG
jgi:hypothetical protein